MSYSIQGRRLYDEALRMMPGLIAAKQRWDTEGGVVLLEGYFHTARRLGLREKDAWQVLMNASLQWCERLVERFAEAVDESPEQIAQEMAAVMMWSTDATDPS